MLAFSLGATAQQGGGRQQRMSPEEQLKMRLDNVKKEVKLTADQEKKVSDLFTETQKKQRAAYEASRSQAQTAGGERQSWQIVREQVQKLQDEETAAMKKILDEGQFKAYSALLEKQRKEQEERMRSRGGGPGGPGGGGPGGGGPGGGGPGGGGPR